MRVARVTLPVLAVVVTVGCLACGGPPPEVPPDASVPSQGGVERAAVALPATENATPGVGVISATEQGLPPELQALDETWLGDFDGMRERRVIRVLTVFAKGLYFLDGAVQRGATYEMVKMFEDEINEQLETGTLRIHVLMIPVTRDRLLPALAAGYGDIAAANLTITPQRLQTVDFANPFLTGVDEVVVTGPSASPPASLDDLAGQEITVRTSSSYYQSLLRFNESQRAAGRAEVTLVPAPEYIEDEDLLEMVNAALLPMVVVDSHKAEFWAQVFDDITVRSDLAVNTGGEIAWALRKDSPQLREVLDTFVSTHRRGSLMGNVVLNRYLKDTRWVRNALSAADLDRFESTVGFFQEHAGTYGFDWLMVAAQGYQESRLDQSARSSAGAVGVMQLLPSTAADPNVGIPDIEILDNNIHAGVKYLRFIRDRYFAAEAIDEMNRGLLSLAAYNAGPNRIARLRRQAAEAGLDPNVWFDNVEVVAAREVGREPVQYVSNIYKYYIAYRLIADRLSLSDVDGQPAAEVSAGTP